MIPHVTNEIKDRIYAAGEGVNVLITEIGGTIGDIEGLPFTEAMRQFASEVGKANVLFLHMTLPILVPQVNWKTNRLSKVLPNLEKSEFNLTF